MATKTFRAKGIDMKVYLINPPTAFLLDDRCNIPLGILFIHSYLKSKGVDVRVVDLAGLSPTEWVLPCDGDIYGITATTPQFETAIKIAQLVKRPGNIIVLGGVHATCDTIPSLETGAFDIVARYEGEDIMWELAQGRPLGSIRGIAYKDNEQVVTTETRPIKQDIDEYPHPLIDAIDISSYHCGVFTTIDGDNVSGIQIITSRGCPHNCSFCCSPFVHRRKVRYHSIAYMRDWLDYLKNHGYKDLYFADDTILINRTRLTQLCDLLKTNGSTWRACVRGDAVTQEKMNQLYSAGCRQVDIGVESGSQRILDVVKKGEMQ
jgi:anaerobic magnesium-protoporphyrin IX monomethyl ester cyclase